MAEGISELGGILLGTSGLLCLVAFLPVLAERLRLPNSVLLAGLGCLLGVLIGLLNTHAASLPAGQLRDLVGQLVEMRVTAEVLLSIFLPVLLFETALNLDGRGLVDDLGPILALALVAVVLTALAVGLSVYAISAYTLAACLLVGAIVATTDPVAVTAIFREVGAPRRLSGLVEGESLLNDAAAIVMFAALLEVVRGRAMPSLGHLSLEIAWEFIGGGLFGALLGRLAALMIGRIDRGGPAETTLSVGVAYLAYVVGDVFLHVSGVVAVVLAGLVLGTYGRTKLAAREWGSVTAIWTQLGFWSSSLIFVLASSLAPGVLRTATLRDLLYLAALIAGALVARAFCLFAIVPFITRGREIGTPYKLVIIWGGLRGAVTLALVLAVTQSPRVPDDVRHLVSVLATGFVLFTLLVQGLTLRPLIRWLRLDQLDPLERLMRERAMTLAEGQILKRLSETAISYGIDPEGAEEVQTLFQRRLEATRDQHDGDEMLRQQLLAALATIGQRESELYVEEQARGMISRATSTVLVRFAGRLIDALKSSGFEGYRSEARRQSRFGRRTRWGSILHRYTGWQRPLAYWLSIRAELLLVRQHALEELIAFTRNRIRALFGDRIAHVAEEVLESRVNDLERNIDSLRLQYPDYWTQVSGRYLSRVAVRLELEAYTRMADERLLSPPVLQNLTSELNRRLRTFEAIPRLDLRLDVEGLIAAVPMLKGLGPEATRELARLLVPRLALPGERIIKSGERGDAMFFIASGAVEVVIPNVEERVRLGTGDFVGELALLTRRPRQADVVAIAYCRLLMLGREAFRTFLRTHPELMRQVRSVAARRASREDTVDVAV